MNNRVFLYGVPGSGKTFLGRKLSELFKSTYIELDEVRHTAQAGKTFESDPFLFVGTTNAYKQLGEENKQNIIQGLIEVRKALHPYVQNLISRSENNFVAEGAFLKPKTFITKGKIFLVLEKNEEIHMGNFFENREINEENVKNFKVARVIQDYLIEESEKLNIEIISSNEKLSLPQ